MHTPFLNNFKSYISIINLLNELQFNDSNFLFRKIDKISNNYFIDSRKIDYYIDKFSDELVESLPFDLDYNAIYLLLFELLNNIFKHSMFSNAFILCQFNQKSNKIEIYIFDDGLSIPKSLKNSGKSFKNDSEAIFNAINGASSDKEKEKLKGRGLNVSANIISFGFGEELLIASGRGLCCINHEGVYSFENIVPFIEGTLLCLKINTNKINIYNHTDFREFDKVLLRSDLNEN